MIIVDLEMSGTNPEKCGIVEIGAVELENPENTFFQKARLDEDEIIYNDPTCERTVLEILNTTEKELRNPKLQSQKELLNNFFKWVEKTENKIFICQVYLDLLFLRKKCIKHKLKVPNPRFIDIGSIAQIKYLKNFKKVLANSEGFNDMGLKNVAKFCGIVDEREHHMALEDAKFETELFSRLVNGKSIIKEFSKFPIPKYLNDKE